MLKKRSSGILLHITSLPGRFGIGDFGPAAYQFIDFLTDSGQNYWQVLPFTYTTPASGNSPYNCLSAFAGNPLLISPEELIKSGLLESADLKNAPSFPSDKIDYKAVSSWRYKLLDTAFERFKNRDKPADYERFLKDNAFWLDDFTLFMAFSRELNSVQWYKWPGKIRNRKPAALKAARKRLKDQIDRETFIQYVFRRQYSHVKYACERHGIQLMGDIPIYVALDSADVWAHPRLFKLDSSRRPKFHAGVPPDYFSKTGQLWGNPVYNWDYHVKTDFEWWMERVRYNLEMFDLVRIDHFRGLIAYWQVPAGDKTAMNGKWVDSPSREFFSRLFRMFPFAPVVAEDLGQITDDVRQAIEKFSFPSMRVLQFGFDGDLGGNLHCPHNYIPNCIAYTGTHDNNTVRGWFDSETTESQKRNISDYVGHKVTSTNVNWAMIRLAMSSIANAAIIPMQDILGLRGEARMNYPSKRSGNWQWKLRKNALKPRQVERLRYMTHLYGRQ